MALRASYLLKTRGLILNVFRQQNDHAKFSTLVRHLQHLALQVRNVTKWKFFLLIHHLHCFCVFLNGCKIKKYSSYSLLCFKAEVNWGSWGRGLSGKGLEDPVLHPQHSHMYNQEHPSMMVSPDLTQSEWSIGCVPCHEFFLPHSLEIGGIH